MEGNFGPDQINWFAKLLPLRICQQDIFDNYADDSLEDDLSDNECEKMLDSKIYILRGIILYGNDHYFTWVFDDSNWVIFDDNMVLVKYSITFEKIRDYIISSKCIPLIIIYEFDQDENELLSSVTQIYEMFKEQIDSDELTKSLKNKLNTKSYWRQDIKNIINVLTPLNIDQIIIDNLETLYSRVF